MSTVLVTDAGRGLAVAFIRSLSRGGHRVVAGDANRISPGRWSRAAAVSFRYPDPFTDPGGAADVLLEQVRDHGVDVLLPMTDATIRVTDAIRGRLPLGCVVGTAPAAAAAVAADKRRTVELAAALGVPVPDTVVVESAAEARTRADRLGWPVVIKPASSLGRDREGTMRKFEVDYAFDGDDLEQRVRALGSGVPVLLQECCTGDGVGVEVLVDDGRIVRSFAHRRIHEVPVTGGASSLREAIALDPELLDHTARLMAELRWTGLAMVEFKVGSSGYRLMEINGRPWGSLPLAVRAGVDFPADYVRLLEGEELDEAADYSIGTTARNLQLEFVWIASVLRGPPGVVAGEWPPRRAALVAFLRLFSPRARDDILSLRDPMPGVAEVLSLVLKSFRKVRR